MDKGKEPASSNPSEKPNIVRIKRKRTETTSDQKKEDVFEYGWKKLRAEAAAARLQKKEEMAAAEAAEKLDIYSDKFEGPLEGSSTESLSSSEEKQKSLLSQKESSTKNPKVMKKKKNVVEQAAGSNREDQTVVSPEESMKNKQVIEVIEEGDEEDDDYEYEWILLSDSASDTLSDAGTADKFPTVDSVDKDKSKRSPPGDL